MICSLHMVKQVERVVQLRETLYLLLQEREWAQEVDDCDQNSSDWEWWKAEEGERREGAIVVIGNDVEWYASNVSIRIDDTVTLALITTINVNEIIEIISSITITDVTHFTTKFEN